MSSPTPGGAPVVHRAAALESDAPGVRSRAVGGDPGGAWVEPVVSEWELREAGWQDCHPYSELNVVLAGRLHVESAGVEVVLGPGDSVLVPAGATGRYWAPEHARMLSVYGVNPDGRTTTEEHSWRITSADPG